MVMPWEITYAAFTLGAPCESTKMFYHGSGVRGYQDSRPGPPQVVKREHKKPDGMSGDMTSGRVSEHSF